MPYFLGELLTAAPWWHSVPPARQRTVRDLTSALRQTRLHAMFADVGQMQRLHIASQVLVSTTAVDRVLSSWATIIATLTHRTM